VDAASIMTVRLRRLLIAAPALFTQFGATIQIVDAIRLHGPRKSSLI
jgi:hypothetical protein